MSNLVEKFKDLMVHLNSEDNDMALEFLEELKALESELSEEGVWIDHNPIDGFPEDLDESEFVYFELRDGYKNIAPELACNLEWSVIEDDTDCEIVKYKIVKV